MFFTSNYSYAYFLAAYGGWCFFRCVALDSLRLSRATQRKKLLCTTEGGEAFLAGLPTPLAMSPAPLAMSAPLRHTLPTPLHCVPLRHTLPSPLRAARTQFVGGLHR